jgi:hypothetical protein
MQFIALTVSSLTKHERLGIYLPVLAFLPRYPAAVGSLSARKSKNGFFNSGGQPMFATVSAQAFPAAIC